MGKIASRLAKKSRSGAKLKEKSGAAADVLGEFGAL